MDSFGDVGCLDGVGVFEIGQRAGDAEDFVVGAGAEAELVDGGLEKFVGAAFENAMLSRGGGVDVRVAGKRIVVASALDVARGLDYPPHLFASRAACSLVRNLLVA